MVMMMMMMIIMMMIMMMMIINENGTIERTHDSLSTPIYVTFHLSPHPFQIILSPSTSPPLSPHLQLLYSLTSSLPSHHLHLPLPLPPAWSSTTTVSPPCTCACPCPHPPCQSRARAAWTTSASPSSSLSPALNSTFLTPPEMLPATSTSRSGELEVT